MDYQSRKRTVIRKAVDAALVPFNVIASKQAQKTYLGIFLFVTASLILFAISGTAYTLFYYNYVPQNVVERVLHLQFGNNNPHGTVNLAASLASLQPYDVIVSLHLPRTPNNIAAGNFMLDLSLVTSDNTAIPDPVVSPTCDNASAPVVARSRRPAILTYASPIVETASTLSGLPWHVLGWKKESETLKVSMFEGVGFAKGRENIPSVAKLVIEVNEKMQFYSVGIQIIARFGGLRWLLYKYRIISFLIFTTAFWIVSVLSMTAIWLALSSYFATSSYLAKAASETNSTSIKQERSDSDVFDPTSYDDLSDTPRTFPILGRQMPLHFIGRNNSMKKQELDDLKKEADEVVETTNIQPLVTEADDEGEDVKEEMSGWRDSGIGTGIEDRAKSVQRRKA